MSQTNLRDYEKKLLCHHCGEFYEKWTEDFKHICSKCFIKAMTMEAK